MYSFCFIYIFINITKNIDFENRIFYVGSTNNINLRLRKHIEDFFVNDPTREVYNYISKYIGMKNWVIKIIRNDIPKGQEHVYERIYYNLLNETFNLINSNKPQPETPITHQQIQNVKKTYDEIIQAKLNNCIDYVDDILNNLKKELAESYKVNENSLAIKNKQLQKSNTELNKLNKKYQENETILKEQIYILKEFNNYLKQPPVQQQPVQQPPVQQQHVQQPPAQQQPVQQQPEQQQVQKINENGEIMKQCEPCGKYITFSNFKKHQRRCKKVDDPPLTKNQLLENIPKIQCEGCSKHISSCNIALHRKRCLTNE